MILLVKQQLIGLFIYIFKVIKYTFFYIICSNNKRCFVFSSTSSDKQNNLLVIVNQTYY